MKFRSTPPATALRPADLPVLPTYHTPEQLAAWRRAVAALPARVHVPPLPKDRALTPEEEEARRRVVLVDTEQRMQADAERMRTDPREVTRRRDLARLRVAQIDRTIGALQARRAEEMARLVLDDDSDGTR